MIGQHGPTDPTEAFAAELSAMRSRIADLERGSGKGPWNTVTGIVKFNGSTTNVVSTLLWRYDGPMIDCQVGWGMSGVPTVGDMSITLSVAAITPASSSNAFHVIGHAISIDQGIARVIGSAFVNIDIGTTSVYVSPDGGGLNPWSSAAPFSWGSSDAGSATLRYRWR